MVKRTLLALSLMSCIVILNARADDRGDESAGEVAEDQDTAAGSYEETDEFLDRRWYISPMGTFIQPGGDRDAKSGWGGYLGIGKIINRYLNLELKGIYDEFDRTDSGGGGMFRQKGGGLDALFFFNRGEFSPYAVAGVGGVETTLQDREKTHFIGEAGLGMLYKLDDHGTSIRSDVRYRYNDDNVTVPGENRFHDLVVNLGLLIPLGSAPEPVKVAKEEPAPPPAVDECSLDSDNDGVNNCDDKCPGTMSGAKVDQQGCLIDQTITLKGVNFEFDSAKLTENAEKLLDISAESLNNDPNLDIEVAGHTDSIGTNAYNLKLSQRRAQSVVNYLKAKGVTNKLYARGYGETKPVASNKTVAGRAENRRVELIIVNE